MIQVNNKLMFHVSKCRNFHINKIYDTNSKDFTHDYSYANDNKVLTEENLESYRAQNLPNFPSRKQCLFVTDKETLDYWFNFFRKKYVYCNKSQVIYINMQNIRKEEENAVDG